MTDSSQPQLPRGAALYLAVVQFLFVTTWILYVIYLPKLLAAAGLPASYTIWILMLDQLVFMVMDVVMGIAADRAGRVLGRIGPLIIAVTAVSCIAFLLIPHAAFLGSAAPAASLVLILAWAATSIGAARAALGAVEQVRGGAWGCIMMAGFSAALAFGRTGREGTALGLLFGMLAVATYSRMGAVAAQLNKMPDYAALLAWGPVALWLAGAAVCAGLATRRELK